MIRAPSAETSELFASAPLLGVCYYPEHWPETCWTEDARRMRELGIAVVRIGEFAWSRIEPRRGDWHWAWLDRAIATLADAGLHVVLGTPTACPPKWLVDECPEILPVDARGRVRGFGSRRHYCFSSRRYRAEARRIVAAMAERYGQHPAVVGWQTDNEFGCHDTVQSYSAAAAEAFRTWLEERYGDVDALNRAWGTVFWSQEYTDFAQVDPPAGAVTEAHPAHRLDFRRFSSEQVAAFNREQVEVLRAASPGRAITHNFMGLFTDFDHFSVGADLDAAAWDSYPLGFLDQWRFDPADRRAYRRQGHPDFAGFHHDLYRGVGHGRLWILEQQPGPVNWAAHNAAPLPGMVRLWLWEAVAHGAELVSLFRWRRASFAQEQMHAGLLDVDDRPLPGAAELARVAGELRQIGPLPAPDRSPVALVFDYAACWVTDIQPQSAGFAALRVAFDYYSALRRCGLDVDVVGPDADLQGYALVVIPCLPILGEALTGRLLGLDAELVIGARTGSKTDGFGVPANGEPGHVQRLLPIRVAAVDGLSPGTELALRQHPGVVRCWLESLDTDLQPVVETEDGRGVWYRQARRQYLGGWPDDAALEAILRQVAGAAGIATVRLEPGVRLRRRGHLLLAVNYAAVPRRFDGEGELLLGDRVLEPGGLALWRSEAPPRPRRSGP